MFVRVLCLSVLCALHVFILLHEVQSRSSHIDLKIGCCISDGIHYIVFVCILAIANLQVACSVSHAEHAGATLSFVRAELL